MTGGDAYELDRPASTSSAAAFVALQTYTRHVLGTATTTPTAVVTSVDGRDADL